MPGKNLTHESSIDDLEAWINDSSKSSNKKKLKKIDETIKQKKEAQKQQDLEEKKYKKDAIGDKYSRKGDPLYGKKGDERKLIIEDYRKQYEQAKKVKNNDANITPEMLEGFMNTIRDKGYNPEEIMEKLESDSYSEEYKNELVNKIMQ